ncbi:MAG: universal stress protein [Chthoniobacterales bacterium]|jgi:nucleotide-binding universal stress UspA family protein
MYNTILVPVENRESDHTILRHIRSLAKLTDAKLTLVHVADGWAARNFERFKLQESEEMKQDREYLASLSAQLESEGFQVKTVLAMGDPATEIIKLAQEEAIDLIAMTTHGHRLLGDFLHGSTADKVRHQVDVPVLLLKVRK